MTTTALSRNAVRAGFDELSVALHGDLVDRDVEIDLLVLAFAGALNLFLLGTPGVGKSYGVDRTIRRITGNRHYHHLITGFGTDSDLFGPFSVRAVKAGKWEREIESFIPQSDSLNLEELWKGGDALLNCLLEILNEGKYKHGTTVIDVPCRVMTCSSNEMPDLEKGSLNAIYDRVILRREVPATVDPDSLRAILDLEPDPAPPPVLTWDQVLAAHDQVAELKVEPAAKDALVQIIIGLRGLNIHPSPRRVVKAMRVAKTRAWLEDAASAGVDHLEDLIHVFWEHPEQAPKVERVVLEITSPGQAEVLNFSDKVVEVKTQVVELLEDLDKFKESARPGTSISPDLMGAVCEHRDKLVTVGAEGLTVETKARGRGEQVFADTWRTLEALWSDVQRKGLGSRRPATLREEIDIMRSEGGQ